jgi:hypothetical protein
MRRLKTLILLFLLPAICHASPWDSHSFWDERSQQVVYWAGSVVVMVVLVSIHLMTRGTSVENKHDPKATAHKVRNQFEGQTILVYSLLYIMVFVSYARARRSVCRKKIPTNHCEFIASAFTKPANAYWQFETDVLAYHQGII